MNDDLLNDISENIVVFDYHDNMDKFLEEKKKTVTKDTWLKLDKTTKIIKLNEFVDDIYKAKYNLDDLLGDKCKKTLLELLEKKKFSRNKDVNYDKEHNKIINIPLLNFNNGVFYLSSERRVSTLKSLPTVKTKRVKQKTSKTTINIE